MATEVILEWEAAVTVLDAGSMDDDHYLVSLDGTQHYEQPAALTDLSATIPEVLPGTYVGKVATIGVDGSTIGEPGMTSEIVISDGMVRVNIAVNVRGRSNP